MTSPLSSSTYARHIAMSMKGPGVHPVDVDEIAELILGFGRWLDAVLGIPERTGAARSAIAAGEDRQEGIRDG